MMMDNDLEANLLGDGRGSRRPTTTSSKKNVSVINELPPSSSSTTTGGDDRGETPPVYSEMPRNFSLNSLGASPMLPPLQELETFFDAKPLSRRTSSIQRPKLDHSLEIEVEVRDLDFAVDKGKKQILHGVNVKFHPGKITALMGPSGSGKTTTLNTILGIAPGTITRGGIYVNGIRGPPRHFKSVAKLIPQEDIILPSFSVRETLNYHAELVLPQGTSKAERNSRVETIITSLGLRTCADTRVGNVDERGISGGERKRCSIAMELISNPCVLCVDEPTSGLDSASAEVVVAILKDLSRVAGLRTVICTIHQPSYRIFSLFDEVVLLTRGRVAFAGKMADLEPFFLRLGHEVPPKENPADHFMRLLQDDECIVSIPAAFEKERLSRIGTESTDSGVLDVEEDILVSVPRYPTSKWHQIKVLIRRQGMDSLKDPHKFFRMLGIKSAVGIMIGTVWYKKANPLNQSALFAVQGALFVCVMNGIVDTLALTILSFPIMRSRLLREYKNGTYAVSSFYIAMMFTMACFSLVFVTFMSTPVYLLVGFQLEAQRLAVFFAAGVLTTLIGNALGVAVGAASKDLMEAQSMLAPLLAPLLLFSGYVIPKSQLPTWGLPFYYASFFQYAIALYELNCFKGTFFADYNLDIFHPTKIRPLKTGDEFLKTIGIDPETHFVGDYLLILAGYAAFFTIVGFFVVRRAVHRIQ